MVFEVPFIDQFFTSHCFSSSQHPFIRVFPKLVVPPFHTPEWSFLVGKPMGLLGKSTILGNPQTSKHPPMVFFSDATLISFKGRFSRWNAWLKRRYVYNQTTALLPSVDPRIHPMCWHSKRSRWTAEMDILQLKIFWRFCSSFFSQIFLLTFSKILSCEIEKGKPFVFLLMGKQSYLHDL